LPSKGGAPLPPLPPTAINLVIFGCVESIEIAPLDVILTIPDLPLSVDLRCRFDANLIVFGVDLSSIEIVLSG
jgi:hypothetical protein